MRKLFIATLLVASGCGSSSSSKPVSGTISGQPFTPTEVSAVTAGPASCTQPVSFEAKAFAVRMASFTGVCTDLTADPLCKLQASARTVTVVFADVGATSAPTLGAGTFAVNPNPANAVIQTSGPLAGTLVAAFAMSVTTGADCSTGTEEEVAKGTLRVDSVNGTTITGSVDLTFGQYDAVHDVFTPGTDTLKGDFTATVCAQSITSDQLCALAGAGGQCSDMSGPHC